MAESTTFLQRMQATLDGMADGPDKEKLSALIRAQNTIERSDVDPRERARAMRGMLRIHASTGPAAKGRSSEPQL